MSTTMPVQELVFKETARVTGLTDFGVEIQSVLSGTTPVPPDGVRFDGAIEGELSGPKISGKISGTDYFVVGADGNLKLDVHAVISTDDGKRIAFHATGIAWTPAGSAHAELRENVTMYSAFPEYAWVNRLQFWSTGRQELSTGETTFSCYTS